MASLMPMLMSIGPGPTFRPLSSRGFCRSYLGRDARPVAPSPLGIGGNGEHPDAGDGDVKTGDRIGAGQGHHLACEYCPGLNFDGDPDPMPVGFRAALHPLAGPLEASQSGQVAAALPEGLLAADSVHHPPQSRAERVAGHPRFFVPGETPMTALGVVGTVEADRAIDGVDGPGTVFGELSQMAAAAGAPAAPSPLDHGGANRQVDALNPLPRGIAELAGSPLVEALYLGGELPWRSAKSPFFCHRYRPGLARQPGLPPAEHHRARSLTSTISCTRPRKHL